MVWYKVDDNLAFHVKVLRAGNPAMGLWVRAGAYSAQHLTDGFIDAHVVLAMGTGQEIESLVNAGLWHPVEGGYQFHDWADHNPPSDQVKEQRRMNAERQQRWRDKARDKAADQRVIEAASNDAVTRYETPTRPDPTRPDREASNDASLGGRARRADGSKGTRFPEQFFISPEMKQWATENVPRVDLREQTQRFADYWRGVAGDKGRKVDWVATWRNWMRRAADDSVQTAPKGTRSDAWMNL